jgi:hypothetical protein
MKKDGRRTEVLLVSLLATLLGACASEVTTPEGGAAINRVVPVLVPLAIPDVWCSAESGAGQDSTAAKNKNRPRPTCEAPRQSASGKGSPTRVVDSTLAASDTTK